MQKRKIETKKSVYKNIGKEISTITEKGYNLFVEPVRMKKDKRKFIKIHIKALNELIYKADIDRKYINFFILLININCNFVEADTNLIRLSIKEIATNMGYTTVYTYNSLNVLKKHNLIDFFKMGKNNYVIINPKYFAKFYNNNYMYVIEYAFEKRDIDLQTLIGDLTIKKEVKNEYSNERLKSILKKYAEDNLKIEK